MSIKTKTLTISLFALLFVTMMNYGHCKEAQVKEVSLELISMIRSMTVDDFNAIKSSSTRNLEEDHDHEEGETDTKAADTKTTDTKADDKKAAADDHDDDHDDDGDGSLDNAFWWTAAAVGFIAAFNILLAAVIGPRLVIKEKPEPPQTTV